MTNPSGVRRRPEWWPEAGMDGRHPAHGHATDVDRGADRELAHVAEADPGHPRAGADRDDHRRRPAEVAERRHVEVVPVEVRDEDRVDVAQPVAGGDRLDPPERADPPAGDRVGQQPDPVELDDERRVTDEVEFDAAGHRQPLRAASG